MGSVSSPSTDHLHIPISSNAAFAAAQPQDKTTPQLELQTPCRYERGPAAAALPSFSVGKDVELEPELELDISPPIRPLLARIRGIDLLLRSACLAFLVVALSSMLTSAQYSVVQVLGFSIQVSMKWSRTLPYRFLVIVQILLCAYAFLQFVFQSVVFVKKSRPTKKGMWLQLAADQACVYLVLAAAAAAAGASRMNKAGFQSLGVDSLHLPTVCTILDKFCNRATIAIIFTILAALASAISAALDVWLLVLAC